MTINKRFIECSSGTYGVDCKQTCSSKCNLGTCDIYTGHCTEGCKKNYISPKCEESKTILIPSFDLRVENI